MRENIPILKIEHKRDFCLPHIEIWCRGESTDLRRWTDKAHKHKPYILFEKTVETVNCYMDERGFEWINNELAEQLKKEPNFVERLCKEYIEIYGKVNKVLEKGKSLNHEELLSFLKDYHSGWPIYESLYFLADILFENESEFKKVKYALDLTDKTGDESDILIRKSLRSIFSELGELSNFLLNEEISNKKIPQKNELEKRKKNYFYANDTLFVDKSREDIERIFDIKLDENNEIDVLEFKGQGAYLGKVKGYARKIMSYSKANEMRDGEILVTAMTTPEFLPALKKASAFVTDEGGVASHVAIVAREMRKPCIVGTKVATRIVNTGDLIEVDAYKEIVRILERAKWKRKRLS